MDISRSYDTFLQLATQEFEYPRGDLAPNTRFIGPVFSPPAAMPIPKWWGDLDGSGPVVHVTQGTINNHDLTRLIGPTVRGLAHSDVIVVVSTGPSTTSVLFHPTFGWQSFCPTNCSCRSPTCTARTVDSVESSTR